jgi:hypothetical protein
VSTGLVASIFRRQCSDPALGDTSRVSATERDNIVNKGKGLPADLEMTKPRLDDLPVCETPPNKKAICVDSVELSLRAHGVPLLIACGAGAIRG